MSIWRNMESAPKDGTKIMLLSSEWDSYPVAYWDWVDGPDEDGSGGFCLWHIIDEDWSTAHDDGLLWPDNDCMPEYWAPIPEDFPHGQIQLKYDSIFNSFLSKEDAEKAKRGTK